LREREFEREREQKSRWAELRETKEKEKEETRRLGDPEEEVQMAQWCLLTVGNHKHLITNRSRLSLVSWSSIVGNIGEDGPTLLS